MGNVFSVITPSLNMLGYLRRCNASIADQGVPYQHIVVDGGSTDGTSEWLRDNPRILSRIGKDKGMYDAVNKGLMIAQGDILSHLNCDEQYLPGTLSFVRDYFYQHPELDVIFGDGLVIRPDGSLLCYRKGTWPSQLLLVATPMYIHTTATFVRRRVIDDGELYDDTYKSVGDLEYYLRLIRKRYAIKHVSRFLSTTAITGHNLGLRSEIADPERARIFRQYPWWTTRFRKILRLAGWCAKFAAGAYFQPNPISYSIFVSEEAEHRTNFLVEHASFRWRTT